MTAAVLFDCGGTLLGLEPSAAAIYRETIAETLGVDLDPAAVALAYRAAEFAVRQSAVMLRGTDKEDFYVRFNRTVGLWLGLDADFDRLGPALRVAFRARRAWRPFADVEASLDELTATGYRLAVVSNWDANLAELLEAHDLARNFERIYDSATLGREKPDPRIFEPVLAGLGLEPGECVYIGDDYGLDAVAARGAGLTPILVDRDGSYGAADCAIVGSLTELGARIGAAGD